MPKTPTRILLCFLASALAAAAAPPQCDLSAYKETAGLKAEMSGDALRVTWQGARGQELRVSFAVDNAAPIIREMAVRASSGQWAVLGRNLSPEFFVIAGRRRISEQQLAPLRALGLDRDPAVIEREKWKVFWDAPMVIGRPANTNPGLPRTADEIRRAAATYNTSTCQVKTDGARLEITFPGLSMGIFAGRLQFTIYKGTN